HRTERGHRHRPATRGLLDRENRVGADGEWRDLGLGDGLAAIDGRAVEEREDGDALVDVHGSEPGDVDAEETPPRRGQRPLAARIALHLDAVAGHRGRQPAARVFFVEVAGLERQQVELVPGQRQERPRGLGIEPGALAEGDLAGGVAHVVAEHAAHEQVRGGALAPLCNRFHVLVPLPGGLVPLLAGLVPLPAGRALSERPLPPPRTAWISARIASAISGAERAPRSRPLGTWTRTTASGVTPPSARWRRVVAPRRDEPSMPM